MQVAASTADQLNKLANVEVKVSDEFVSLGANAVLRCRLSWPSPQQAGASVAAGQPGAELADWFTSDGVRIEPGESKGNKFVAFKGGELHVVNVEPRDLQRTYGCRMRLAGSTPLAPLVASSTGGAQLIATEHKQQQDQHQHQHQHQQLGHQLDNQQPQLLHSLAHIHARESELVRGADRLLIPCALSQQHDDPLVWYFEPAIRDNQQQQQQQQLVRLDLWAAANSIQFVDSLSGGQSNQTVSLGQPTSSQRPRVGRIWAAPTHLVLEGATSAWSGRFVLRLGAAGAASASRTPTQQARQVRTVCDTRVIISRPLGARVRLVGVAEPPIQPPRAGSRHARLAVAAPHPAESEVAAWLSGFLYGRQPAMSGNRNRNRRRAIERRRAATPSQRIKASGAALIEAPASRQAGQSVQLDCLISGGPVDGVRWLRNGRPVEPSGEPADWRVSSFPSSSWSSSSSQAADGSLTSSLQVEQLGESESGLQVFECFAYNQLGDSVRAAKTLDVVQAASQEPLGESDEPEPSSLGESRRCEELVAAVLEGEWLELKCPFGNVELAANQQQQLQQFKNLIEWHKLPDEPAKQQPAGDATATSTATATATATGNKQRERKTGSLNQLFAGDARFVINGSSLQLRSPSRRHDEAAYVCVQLAAGQPAGHSRFSGAHQSSWRPASWCDSPALFVEPPTQTSESWLASSAPLRLRIFAKPKIDPFEFNRNLEEGMRTVLVCALVSGQPPVQITWFKDGNLLLEDELLAIDQANEFSSSLIFDSLRAAHSGLYTCVAANAFSSTNHSSRLLVNVAPFFIEPPRNAEAVLSSNVLIKCRAGGQPSPQIRWRKLSAASPRTPSGGGELQSDPMGTEMQSASVQLQQLQSTEFRVISSNSHIQILENGSMFIRDLEASDAARYSCQASNGIQPSVAEVVELRVLSPASFELNSETVSVKRSSLVKFRCAPRGDQPMRIEWRKEGRPLVPAGAPSAPASLQPTPEDWKYTETVQVVGANSSSGPQIRHNRLVLEPINQPLNNQLAGSSSSEPASLSASELLINYADRQDSGVFVCAASNPYGSDQLTYRLLVQEPPDAPADLRLELSQPTSLRLAWTPPFDGHLAISHYVLEYRRRQQTNALLGAQEPNEWSRLVVSVASGENQYNQHQNPVQSSTNSSSGSSSARLDLEARVAKLSLRSLVPRAAYQVRLAALNQLGQGAFSNQLQVSTAEQPPSTPASDLRLQAVSSSQLRAVWRSPEILDEQAPIKGYQLAHRRLDSADWQASGSVGSLANATNVYLQEEPPSGGRQQQQQQQQQLQQQVGGKQAAGQFGQQAEFELLIGSLDKETKYEVRVQPFNSMGVGPSIETVGQTLRFDRPGTPVLRLVAVRRQSFELRWSMQADQQPLMGFSLFYKCEYDDWQEVQLGLIYNYLLENLRCGNKYQLYLSAFNVVGRSDPSEVLSARTEGTVPIAPDKQLLIRANSTQVQLDLSVWQSGGCPISGFMIQFKRLHDTNWFILSEGATGPASSGASNGSSNSNSNTSSNNNNNSNAGQQFGASQRITIPDLAPSSWYKLLVTALNEAGSTNAEYLFSTLTPDGQPAEPPFPLEQLGGSSTGGSASGQQSRYSLTNLLARLLHLTGPNQQQADLVQAALLPLACLLLLLLTARASYVFYARRVAALVDRSASSSSSTASSTASSSGAACLASQCANPADSQHLKHTHHQHRLLVDGGQSLKLLAGSSAQPASLFLSAGGASSSSGASTQSTSYAFDRSSMSALGSQSGGQKVAKLQLIDESSLMSANNNICDEYQDQQHQPQFVYANAGPAGAQQTPPPVQLYTHVDLLGAANQHQEPFEAGAAAFLPPPQPSVGLFAHHHCGPNSLQHQHHQQHHQQAGQRLVSSSSFASASELAGQQHQHQVHQSAHFYGQDAQEEPIYQRLGLSHLNGAGSKTIGHSSYAGHSATLGHKAQTLRLSQLRQAELLDSLKTMTLHLHGHPTSQNQLDNCDSQHQQFVQPPDEDQQQHQQFHQDPSGFQYKQTQQPSDADLMAAYQDEQQQHLVCQPNLANQPGGQDGRAC